MLRLYTRAIWAWLCALLKPMDLVEKSCPRGHSILLDWDSCPDCRWIDRASRFLERRRSSPLKFLLYCYQGTHQGELMTLVGQEETMGSSILDSRVLTCESPETSGRYRTHLSQGGFLTAEGKQPFQMNGADAWKEQLFDYDEIEILGNRFLVLDLQAYAGNQV